MSEPIDATVEIDISPKFAHGKVAGDNFWAVDVAVLKPFSATAWQNGRGLSINDQGNMLAVPNDWKGEPHLRLRSDMSLLLFTSRANAEAFVKVVQQRQILSEKVLVIEELELVEQLREAIRNYHKPPEPVVEGASLAQPVYLGLAGALNTMPDRPIPTHLVPTQE